MKTHGGVQPSSGAEAALPVVKEALLGQFIHQSCAQKERKHEEYRAPMQSDMKSLFLVGFFWPQFHYRDINVGHAELT